MYCVISTVKPKYKISVKKKIDVKVVFKALVLNKNKNKSV